MIKYQPERTDSTNSSNNNIDVIFILQTVSYLKSKTQRLLGARGDSSGFQFESYFYRKISANPFTPI